MFVAPAQAGAYWKFKCQTLPTGPCLRRGDGVCQRFARAAAIAALSWS